MEIKISGYLKDLKDLFNQGGYIGLTTVVTILGIMFLSSVGVMFAVEGDVFSVSRQQLSPRALYAAETGINNYVWKLNQDDNYYKTTVDPAQQDWVANGEGEYFLTITETTGVPGVIIESTGRVSGGGSTEKSYRKVKARIQKKSFLHYLYFTNHETVEGTGNNIWFVTGDRIRGPLHSNDRININGGPVFEGKVSTSRTLNQAGGSNPQFLQGYEENAPPLEMPSTNQELKGWAQLDGYYYYGMTTIQLLSTGSLQITNSNALSTGPTGVVSLPANGIIYVDGQAGQKYSQSNGDVFVKGTLSGMLTLAAKNNIYITGDVYYNDPATDLLGLIGENYVYINHWNQSGQDVAPMNIEVNAAIFALNHSFGFEDHTTGLKGTLTVKGAIAQRYRGPVGTFNQSGRVSGYTKNYRYDDRMLYLQPPRFIEPLNSGFEISQWEELRPTIP